MAERNRNTVEPNRKVRARFFERIKMRKGVTYRDVSDTKKKVSKGVRGMPRLLEAKKDVLSCEKLRRLAKTNRPADIRMGQPGRQEACHTAR